MGPQVEPLNGPELDRVVTALLNATGCVHQLIEEEVGDAPLPMEESEGLAAIGRIAMRMRAPLAVFSEHHTDDELSVITEFLAIATILIAREHGFDDVFYGGPDSPPAF